jgi:beta-glucosidase
VNFYRFGGASMGIEEHRDWDSVDYTNLLSGNLFPPNFMWGVATASHQIEGGNTNNWSAFEPRSKSGQLSGDACDHWNRKKEDIQLIKDLNVSHYRFSIEWSRIEPQQGMWDEDAVQWYSDLVDKLLDKGIQPMATLHHFTHPLWWDEKGEQY